MSSDINPIETTGALTRFLPSSPRNRILAGAALLFVIAVIVYMVYPSGKLSASMPLFTVNRGTFLVSITESGEIIAKNAITITTPRVRGNLKIVFLKPEGTYIKDGDTLVMFDPTEALNNLREAEGRLEIANSEREKLLANQKSQMTRLESDLQSAELSFELSKLSLEQMKFEAEVKQREIKLQHKKNELTYQKAKQDLESQKIVQRSELSKLDLDVQQKKSDLERAQREFDMLTVTATAEGLVVYERNWASGRKIAIGDAPWPGMTLISLPDLSSMQSITYVNEVDVSRARVGQKVQVRLDAFRDSLFEGIIEKVAPLGKNREGSSTIKVFEIAVQINSNSPILKPGMTTANKIIVSELPDKLFVPQEAIFEKNGKQVVYVKKGNSFNARPVELGEKSEDYIVVKMGVNPGDEIALRNPELEPEDKNNPAGTEGNAAKK